MALLQVTSLAANLLLGNMPVALIPSFKMYVILLLLLCSLVLFLIHGQFFVSEYPERVRPYQCRLEACAARHGTTAVQRRLGYVDAVCRGFGGFCPQKGHAEGVLQAQEKYAGAEGWVDWVPVRDDEAIALLLDDQCLR